MGKRRLRWHGSWWISFPFQNPAQMTSHGAAFCPRFRNPVDTLLFPNNMAKKIKLEVENLPRQVSWIMIMVSLIFSGGPWGSSLEGEVPPLLSSKKVPGIQTLVDSSTWDHARVMYLNSNLPLHSLGEPLWLPLHHPSWREEHKGPCSSRERTSRRLWWNYGKQNYKKGKEWKSLI